MTTAVAAVTNRTHGWSAVWGVLLILFGLLAVALPLASSFGVVLVVGWMLVFSSAAQILHAFQSKGVGHIAWKILVGVLYLGVGIYFMNNPMLGVAALTLRGRVFLSHGRGNRYCRVFQRAESQRIGLDTARWNGDTDSRAHDMAALAASSIWATGTLVGISMVMTGVTRLMISVAERRLAG